MPNLLSVVIPVFNEERTVVAMLDRVAEAQCGDLLLELVIVNDGSTDRSPELIRSWMAAHPGVHAVCIDKENGGKGSAVKAAVAATTGEAVIIQDADLEYDPRDYAACAGPIFRGECEAIDEGRGLYHRSPRASTRIVLRHLIEPTPGYSFELYRTQSVGDGENRARILFNPAEALGLCESIAGALYLVSFGIPMLIPHDTSVYLAETKEMRRAVAAA